MDINLDILKTVLNVLEIRRDVKTSQVISSVIIV